MSRCLKLIGMICLPVSLFVTVCRPNLHESDLPSGFTEIQYTPRIEPDYTDTVIPPNIAPLNFIIDEHGLGHRVKIHSANGKPIILSAKHSQVLIPIKSWKRLLTENTGQKLIIDVYTEYEPHRWKRFVPVTITIAAEKIDSYLAYRLIEPQYKYYRMMGLFQRNLENFVETCFLHNRVTGGNCMNCHTFYKNRTDTMIFHMRGGAASGTMLIQGRKMSKVNTATDFNRAGAYASWHPNGSLIVFSVNSLKQFFHSTGESRDVLDIASNLILYDTHLNQVTSSPLISDPDRLETFPSWAPDGRFLYFCSAPKFESFYEEDGDLSYDRIRYDLKRIQYDESTGRFHHLETVLSSDETQQSILIPRISPDGRYLLFCMVRYGNFPIYRPSSDLYVMDLNSGRYYKPDINSDSTADSYHSWSSNSRWIVFSSKRDNGFCARPYISYIDSSGQFHKPFVMPQKNPSFYQTFLMTYNVPEFSVNPIQFRWQKIVQTAFDSENVRNAKLDAKVQVNLQTETDVAEEDWKIKPSN
jgi:hypothetical protein